MALKRFFAEADTTEVEVTHKTTRSAAFEATSNFARRELRLSFCFCDKALFGHILYFVPRRRRNNPEA
jgi:hypothetical protein